MSDTDFEGPDYDPAFDAEYDTERDPLEEVTEEDVPADANPADVEEQRREVGDDEEDDYR
ncbi:hypothetical protein OG809_01720 [Kribbella soli]|jgi:hypothetical protein